MIVAVSWVKDEADIIASTVTHMAAQVDRVIIADQMSTDGTRDILAGLPVTVIDDAEPGFHQSRIMTRLAQMAIDAAADFVVPFDADELWVGLDQWERRRGVHRVPVFDRVPTVLDDPALAPVERLRWRSAIASPSGKVFGSSQRDMTVAFGNHRIGHDDGRPVDGVVIHHFPNRSREQFIAKVRRGATADLDRDPGEWYGAHWAEMEPDAELLYDQVFLRADPESDPMLVEDPVIGCPSVQHVV